MTLPRSRVTSQGQISVPAEIRRRLGIAPGTVLEWEEEEDGRIVVRRVGGVTSEEMRKALFPNGPPKRLSVADMDRAIEREVLRRHARR